MEITKQNFNVRECLNNIKMYLITMCNLKIQNSSHMKNIGTPKKLLLLPKTKRFGP